ncbi:hypothetical protein AAVH_12520 [Aphelenchoides avenae]|nr:hypothetical protein AAVH_12520 [Aphelenchus avenae]
MRFSNTFALSLKPAIKKPTLAARSVPIASGSNCHPAKPRGRPPKKTDAAEASQNVRTSADEQPEGDEPADAPAGFRRNSGQRSAAPRARPWNNLRDVAAPQSGPSTADEQGGDEGKADSPSAEADHSEGSAAATIEDLSPLSTTRGRQGKNPSDVAAPQNGPSKTDEQPYADADASVLMAFANVVIDVPPFPTEVEVQVSPTEEAQTMQTEHVVGEDDTMPPQADRGSNGVSDEATADSSLAEADHGDGSAATTVKGPLQCPRTRGRQKQTHTDVAARDVPPFPNEEELQVAPTEEAQAVPAEHVVGGDEAMPPHADRDKNGVGEDLKADPPSAEADHADGSAATTDEGPSASASAVHSTSGKRRGRPRKQSNVAVPHNTESPKAKTASAPKMDKNAPPLAADRASDETTADSPSAEADHVKGSAATAIEGPSTLASAIQRTSLKRRGRPKKRSSQRQPTHGKADNNVQPPAADRDNSSSDEEDTSIVMEAVHDLVNVSSGKRGDGQANTSPEAHRGGDAAAADAKADRSPAEAPHVEETADATKEDSTASVTTTDNSTRLGPSDFEQPSEPDPDASSVPSAVDSVSGVDIDALDGLCSQMASAGVKASRTEPEPSTSNEAPIHPLPVTGAALTSNRLYGPIVHNDPDELRLDSMALTDQHITVGDDGQNDSSDNNDDAEPMPAVHNADDDASSDGTFEDAPGSPQEQRDVDTGSTVADASSGGEAPGQLRCVMGWTAGQHLEVETLRETNERYQAEKADLQAQLQARTEQNSQLQGHLEAFQLRKDQESAAMREQCEKRLRELQQSADAMAIHWQQRSHDFEQSSHDFEQQCQQLQVELAQARQAAHDAAQQVCTG